MLLTSSVHLVTRVPSPFVSKDGPSVEIVFSLGSLTWPHTPVLWADSVLWHPVICHLVMFKPVFSQWDCYQGLYTGLASYHTISPPPLSDCSPKRHAGRRMPRVKESSSLVSGQFPTPPRVGLSGQFQVADPKLLPSLSIWTAGPRGEHGKSGQPTLWAVLSKHSRLGSGKWKRKEGGSDFLLVLDQDYSGPSVRKWKRKSLPQEVLDLRKSPCLSEDPVHKWASLDPLRGGSQGCLLNGVLREQVCNTKQRRPFYWGDVHRVDSTWIPRPRAIF